MNESQKTNEPKTPDSPSILGEKEETLPEEIQKWLANNEPLSNLEDDANWLGGAIAMYHKMQEKVSGLQAWCRAEMSEKEFLQKELSAANAKLASMEKERDDYKAKIKELEVQNDKLIFDRSDMVRQIQELQEWHDSHLT
jgi:chromosome segregation ATPase